MNVGLSTLYDIGSNYSVKLNDKEILIYESNKEEVEKKSSKQKLEKEQEETAKETQKSNDPHQLSPDEERLVNDLQSRDSEVRAHEAAHQSAGGAMTGAATYTYQQGPNGKMYAIGGEVSISTSGASSPEEAIANARQIVTAAMAAGNPSPQDYSVAASARIMEMKAQQQLAKQLQEETLGKTAYQEVSTSSDIHTNELNISA